MNNPQYLLRFDDICPTMNWRVWAEIETVLIQRRLKPLLAVVPDNRDPGLQVDTAAGDFWDRVRAWQEWGWTIAMHGFQHRYVSRNAGMAAVRKKSEFAGLPAREQREKLQRGAAILKREGITSRAWIAPGNAFDATTVALLPEVGIQVISAGYFQFPYITPITPTRSPRSAAVPAASSGGVPPPAATRVVTPRELAGVDACATTSDALLNSSGRGWMTWVPQQMHYFRPAPAGVWTVCYHHNAWDSARLQKFRADVDHYHANIVSLAEVVDGSTPREGKWSAWLCTHPRLSELLIRAELKLWAVTGGGWRVMRARKEPACHASRSKGGESGPRVAGHP